ncbi:MAG: hypothetical protein WCY89_12535 [Flavobacteriaceae bacterium]
MKVFRFSMLCFLCSVFFLIGCQNKKIVDNAEIKSENEAFDIFCDTTKIADFKTNLRIIDGDILSNSFIEYQDKKAKDYITESCEEEPLFCKEIERKFSKVYAFDSDWKILITGYLLEDAIVEESSASFFVLTIIKNEEIWFTDFLEDLMGEIKVELKGFEHQENQIVLWGEAYPYFGYDYGKFRLTVNEAKSSYEFQCQAQH